MRITDLFSGPGKRLKLLVLIGLTLPLLGAFLSANWALILWALLPVLCLELIPWPSWRFLRNRGYRQQEIRTGWLVGSAAFLVLFVACTFLEPLNSQHKLQGYSRFAHRNWLGLGWLDDVTYRNARRAPVSNRLTVVTMPQGVAGHGIALYRRALADLIRRAYHHNAVGVGLDYYFDQTTGFDEEMGRRAKAYYEASQGFFRVFLGYHFEDLDDGELLPRTPARSLIDGTMARGAHGYFGSRSHGHVVVFNEKRGPDKWVRSVPVGFAGREGEPALSVRMAGHMLRVGSNLAQGEGESEVALPPEPVVPTPRGGLLHFVPPDGDLLHLRIEEVEALDALGELEPLFRRRFVLVGTHDGEDMHRTPFFDGKIPGVFLQAYATEALLQQHWVTRAEWWYALLGIVLPVLSMATRFSRRRALLGMFLSTVALTLFVFGLSGVIVYTSNVWIDTSYVVVAIWAFFLCGLAGLKVQRLRRQRREKKIEA